MADGLCLVKNFQLFIRLTVILFLMRNGTKFKRFLFWLIEYFSAKRSAVTIACSEGEYKEAMKLSKRSTYVNNGINTKT